MTNLSKFDNYEEGFLQGSISTEKKWWQFWKLRKVFGDVARYTKIGNLIQVRLNNGHLFTTKLPALPAIEKISFLGEDGKTYEAWVTEDRIYVLDKRYWPNFKWADDWEENTCIPVVSIPTVGIQGYYRKRCQRR